MATVSGKAHVAFDEELFRAYEDGKHRRYSLLFAVNGGAFALARLLDAGGASDIGNLTLDRLAYGMALFTLVMSVDICAFGLKMRAEWKNSRPDIQKISVWDGHFALPGQFVLTAIWGLISAGWLL